MEIISHHHCFGGEQRFYRHDSTAIGLPMRFSVYLPPQALADSASRPCPALFFLAGLTCSEETFMIKAAAQRVAAELGLILITPDTSPRGANLPGDSDNWDFGVAAGFYLDASAEPWHKHYRMHSYIVSELRDLVCHELPVNPDQIGIFGHSMGGHGALVLALRHPALFCSVSAFAPIANPSVCPWGEKAFTGYLGPNRSLWAEWDATELMKTQTSAPFTSGILIDQGLADNFLLPQLFPDNFETACKQAGQALQLRYHDDYDHGYYFISSFIEDHLYFHHQNLTR